MAEYNLTPLQRGIVQALVEVYQSGYDGEFVFAGPTVFGSEPAITFIGPKNRIRADLTDLMTLEDEGLVTLRQGPKSVFGTIRQLAYDAVESDFKIPQPSIPGGSVIIGNFIQTMSGGRVQGGAGSNFTLAQNASPELDLLLQRFVALTDQLTEVLPQIMAGRELRDAMGEISEVQTQLESETPDTTLVRSRSRSLGERIVALLDVGDKVGGSIQTGIYASQALIVAAGWANIAYEILQGLNIG